MGYDAWINVEHEPITKEEFERAKKEAEEKTGQRLPEELYWEEDRKRNDGKGYVWTRDWSKNPDYEALQEFGKVLSRITDEPVLIEWIDSEGDYSEIYTPEGEIIEQKKIYETPLGVFESYDAFVEAYKKHKEKTEDREQ